jgi:hypothetical protein
MSDVFDRVLNALRLAPKSYGSTPVEPARQNLGMQHDVPSPKLQP